MRYRFLRFPEGKLKAVTFSYDDGVLSDMKLAEIFFKNGIKATFNLNSAWIGKKITRTCCGVTDVSDYMTANQIKCSILDKGHEIAIHGEICDYIKAYHRLVFSADSRIIHNPTAKTVWFETDGGIYKIEPSQTIKIQE